MTGSGSTPPAVRSGPPPMADVTVANFVGDPRLGVALERIAGEAGLDRPIRHPRVQKNGLALAGHYYGVVPTRVQVLGETELSYLDTLTSERRGEVVRGFFSLGLSCVVLTRHAGAPRAVLQAATATSTPLFVSAARSSQTINAFHSLLDAMLAPSTTLHGVLVDVFGIGLLLLGKSGIGKSECAVELVLRGHRLVADDVVRCEWRPPDMIFGSAVDVLRHHVEVRGLGLLDIKSLFGVTAVRDRKSVEMIVRLDEWDESKVYDRLGVDDEYFDVLGTPLRLVTVPVRPGRNMAAMLEMAARNELLRRAGRHSARELLARLEETAGGGTTIAMDDRPGSVLGVASAAGAAGASGAPGRTAQDGEPATDAVATSPDGGGRSSDPHPSEAEGAAPPAKPFRDDESSAWVPSARNGGEE